MLNKILQMPTQVKLAVLFLLAVFALIAWAVPAAVVGLAITIAVAYCIVIVLDYFVRL